MTPGDSAGTASGPRRVELELTGELRRQIESVLFRSGADNYDRAIDMLSAEVLQPLLAKLRAVEDCYQDGHSQGYVLDSVLRRALDG